MVLKTIGFMVTVFTAQNLPYKNKNPSCKLLLNLFFCRKQVHR